MDFHKTRFKRAPFIEITSNDRFKRAPFVEVRFRKKIASKKSTFDGAGVDGF